MKNIVAAGLLLLPQAVLAHGGHPVAHGMLHELLHGPLMLRAVVLLAAILAAWSLVSAVRLAVLQHRSARIAAGERAAETLISPPSD